MKKISSFLAAVLFFTAVALSFGPAQTVQAFAESEINDSEFAWSQGPTVAIDFNWPEGKSDESFYLAFCSNVENPTKADAVYGIDLDYSKVTDGILHIEINLKEAFEGAFEDGLYKLVIFDSNGMSWYSRSTGFYTKKTPFTSFSCDVMNNDGFAYAYVYSVNNRIQEVPDHFPELYASDRSTKVASFDSYSVEEKDENTKVFIYKLKIDNAEAFQMDSTGHTYLYYRINTKTGDNTVESNNYIANVADTNGFGNLSVFDFNIYMDKINQGNAGGNGSENNPPSNDGGESNSSEDNSSADSSEDTASADPEMKNSTASVGGSSVPITVNTIQSSEVPAVQDSINSVVSWVGQISSRSSEVVKVLKAFAPAEKVSSVTTGGTLDLSVPSDVDISSGVKVTFTDSNIKASVKNGDKVIVLHVKHDGSIEYIPAVAGDGTITATFTSLSPIAWFKVGTNTGGVSPKTGVSFWDFLMRLFR